MSLIHLFAKKVIEKTDEVLRISNEEKTKEIEKSKPNFYSQLIEELNLFGNNIKEYSSYNESNNISNFTILINDYITIGINRIPKVYKDAYGYERKSYETEIKIYYGGSGFMICNVYEYSWSVIPVIIEYWLIKTETKK